MLKLNFKYTTIYIIMIILITIIIFIYYSYSKIENTKINNNFLDVEKIYLETEEKKSINNIDKIDIIDVSKDNKVDDLVKFYNNSKYYLNNKENNEEKYITFISNLNSSFNINEFIVIYNTIYDSRINKDDLFELNIDDINNIKNKYSNGEFVKIKKETKEGLIINSDLFYIKYNKNGKDMYFDENSIMLLNNSRKNGFDNFFVRNINKQFNTFDFISGFNKDEGYGISLIKNILKIDNKFLNNIVTGDLNEDIKFLGILKKINNQKIDNPLYMDILSNIK